MDNRGMAGHPVPINSLGIVVTGASSGIGAAAAVELTRAGHRVVATGRSEAKLTRVYQRMVAVAPAGTDVPQPIAADLASLAAVKSVAGRIAERFPKLDVLVNNAGVQPHRRMLSADGYELGFAVNHLAPFLLTELLTGPLKSGGGRVITTASSTHAKATLDLADPQLERDWTCLRSYARSKLANILFTRELRNRSGLAATCFHPGAISTDLNRDAPMVRMIKPFERFVFGSPEAGAGTLIWLCTAPEGGSPAAYYYAKRRPAVESAVARDPDLAARLWDMSLALVHPS